LWKDLTEKSAIPIDISVQDVLNVDAHIVTFGEISDADIVAEVTKNTGFVGDDNSDNEDNDSTVVVPPT